MVDVRKLKGSREVFVAREEGYFPVLVNSGERIFAVIRAGAGHVGITGRLDLVVSDGGGLTWSKPSVIADSEWDDRNPAFGLTGSGILVLAYHRQGSYDSNGIFAPYLDLVEMMVTRSTDSGKTWEKPRRMNLTPLLKHSPYGRILALPDGMLLMPVYGKNSGKLSCEKACPEVCLSYVVRSRDDGMTWEDPSVIGANINEAALAFLPNEELLAVVRTEGDAHLVALRSKDLGYTWSDPVAITKAGEHPADLTLLSNDLILLVYGHRLQPFGVRGKISRDMGKTWEEEIVFADDRPSPDCGYPSTVRLPSGKMITAYYSAGDHKDYYRGEGSFCKAVVYDEKELIWALGG